MSTLTVSGSQTRTERHVRMSSPEIVPPAVRWTFYGLLFSIPFEMPERSIPVEIPTVIAFVFIAAALLFYRREANRIPRSFPWFAATFYIGTAATIYHDRSHLHEVAWRVCQIGLCLLLFWIVHALGGHRDLRLRGALSLVAGNILRAGLQLGGLAAPLTPGAEDRARTFNQDPNNATGILAVAFVIVAGMIMQGRLRLRWKLPLLISALGIIGLAMLQMASRGGLIALAAGLVVLLLRPAKFTTKLTEIVIMAMVAGIFVYYASASEMVRSRFEAAVDSNDLAGRERIYPLLIDMFHEKPGLGWGLLANEYELASRLVQLDPRHVYEHRDPHNTLLDVLTFSGSLGLACFLVGLALCARGAWRDRRGPEGCVSLAAFAVAITMGMSVGWIASKTAWLVYSFAASAPGAPSIRAVRGHSRRPAGLHGLFAGNGGPRQT